VPPDATSINHDHEETWPARRRQPRAAENGLVRSFPPATPGQRRFLAAVAADQQETDRFLAAFAGIVSPEQYFTLRTVARILGSRGIRQLTAVTANNLFPGLPQRGPAHQAGARASRVPGWSQGAGRCGR
jgi:hypothetical protein